MIQALLDALKSFWQTLLSLIGLGSPRIPIQVNPMLQVYIKTNSGEQVS